MPTHETHIRLGEPYRDTATGFEGVAISLHIYFDNIWRITLAALDKNGAVAEQTFDSPRLEHLPAWDRAAHNASIGFTQ